MKVVHMANGIPRYIEFCCDEMGRGIFYGIRLERQLMEGTGEAAYGHYYHMFVSYSGYEIAYCPYCGSKIEILAACPGMRFGPWQEGE